MATVRRELRVASGPDPVWNLISDAERIPEWFPGISAAEMGSDDDGEFRTVTLGSGLRLVERILTNDPVNRRFQYRIEGGLFREHLGTVDVIDLKDATTLMVYSTDAEPAVFALVIGGATADALRNIATLAGVEPIGPTLGPRTPTISDPITTGAN